MSEHPNNAEDILLLKIANKRKAIAKYIAKNEPHQRKLVNASIISGAVAAALTAGPGVGGNEFIQKVNDSTPFDIGIPTWQIICVAATILSVASVVFNGMIKTHDMSAKISSARGCDAKLEGLELRLALSQLKADDAASLYSQYINEIAHI